MNVLGLDPGSIRFGYAVVCRDNVIKSGVLSLSGPLHIKAAKIFSLVADLLDAYSVAAVALEEVFYGRNVKSLVKLSQVRGAALAAAGFKGVEVFEYHPSVVKKNVVGIGSADKAQVKWMIKKLFNITDDIKEDEADAIAVALCHIVLSHAEFY